MQSVTPAAVEDTGKYSDIWKQDQGCKRGSKCAYLHRKVIKSEAEKDSKVSYSNPSIMEKNQMITDLKSDVDELKESMVPQGYDGIIGIIQKKKSRILLLMSPYQSHKEISLKCVFSPATFLLGPIRLYLTRNSASWPPTIGFPIKICLRTAVRTRRSSLFCVLVVFGLIATLPHIQFLLHSHIN